MEGDPINHLIKQLGAGLFRTRQAAKDLEAIGAEAIGALRKAAAENPDLETRMRAERLIEAYEARMARKHANGVADEVKDRDALRNGHRPDGGGSAGHWLLE